jgi:hypothetical protein
VDFTEKNLGTLNSKRSALLARQAKCSLSPGGVQQRGDAAIRPGEWPVAGATIFWFAMELVMRSGAE